MNLGNHQSTVYQGEFLCGNDFDFFFFFYQIRSKNKESFPGSSNKIFFL